MRVLGALWVLLALFEDGCNFDQHRAFLAQKRAQTTHQIKDPTETLRLGPAWEKRAQEQQESNTTMAEPWRCSKCKVFCKANAEFCSRCGGRWNNCMERGMEAEAMVLGHTRPHLGKPQHLAARKPSRPGGEVGKGGKAADKGKGTGKAQKPPARTDVHFPSLAELPQPPVPRIPPKPPTTSSQPAMTEDRRLLSEILAAIPKESLPADLLQRAGQQARKDLEQLRRDNASFTASREHYVGQLLELWKKQGASRLESMAAFEEKEAELSSRLALLAQLLAIATQEEKDSERSGKELNDENAMEEIEEAEAAVETAASTESEVRARYRKAREKFKAQHAQIEGLLLEAQEDAAAATREGSRTPRRRTKEEPTEAPVDLTAESPPGEARPMA
ncbi:PUF3 [Symbiodinium sp. CCMP2592]|nr:PUF3 [Symbiodinium sp. CCMP2592]